ncbi:VOC family protein [Methylobacillus glycogenes]|uniref:VOC family protein n=1 Tax=Methylobacillus glycogenes TaxID=406 RepID=UPI00046EC3FD|nr:VOC family protein [Methylobacillus glycogenes]MBL8505685.1 VOC family protein [Methylobacillus glycogenes]
MSLKTVEIKTFVPAKDFALSQRFYQDIGFEKRSEGGGVAYFCVEHCAFLLQDFYVKEYAENFMMHLQVEDVAAWHEKITQSGITENYGSKISPLVDQEWRMRDFVFSDPSGVLWRIGQNI